MTKICKCITTFFFETQHLTVFHLTSIRSHQIGHFTQVVRDKAHAIGCASSKYLKEFENKEWNATLLVCNYSHNNPLIGDKVYVAGPTASACRTGTNPNYPGLCSELEQYQFRMN